jgi:hypothetical protein
MIILQATAEYPEQKHNAEHVFKFKSPLFLAGHHTARQISLAYPGMDVIFNINKK